MIFTLMLLGIDIAARVALALAVSSEPVDNPQPVAKPKPVAKGSHFVSGEPKCPIGVPQCGCGCLMGETCRCAIRYQQPVSYYQYQTYTPTPVITYRSVPVHHVPMQVHRASC